MENQQKEKYSVLMSLYYKEKPAYLRQALDSIFCQTVVPDDVVLVEDGTVGQELETVVCEYENKYPQLNVVRFDKNRGLGYALNDGIKECRNEIVARMDTDDVAMPTRMEEELHVMREHPEYGMISSWIDEFITDTAHVTSVRKLPEMPDEVMAYAKKRCPVNHPVVMYRKSEVLAVGGYQTKYFPEDYFLWIKMLMNGCKVYNIQKSLLWFRYNPDTFARRGGWKYACDEVATQWNMYRMGFISVPRLLVNVLIRFTVRIVPNSIRGKFYRYALRGKR